MGGVTSAGGRSMGGWKAAYSTYVAFPPRRFPTRPSRLNSTWLGAAPDCRSRRRRCGIEYGARTRRVGKGAWHGPSWFHRPRAPCPPAAARWARRARPVRTAQAVPGAFAHPATAGLAMTTRREFLEIAAAMAAIIPGEWSRAFAQQQLRQADLLSFESLGNVTLVHIADLHAQLVPVYFREASVIIGS